MTNTIKHFKCGDTEYPLAFTMNVIEKIQDKYGSYEKWGDMTDSKKQEPNIGALKFGITEMINEGIDIENENLETKKRIFNSKTSWKTYNRIRNEEINRQSSRNSN